MKDMIKDFISDDNCINEKNIMGVLSFILFIIMSYTGISENILNSVLIFSGACFGISCLEKIKGNKNVK